MEAYEINESADVPSRPSYWLTRFMILRLLGLEGIGMWVRATDVNHQELIGILKSQGWIL